MVTDTLRIKRTDPGHPERCNVCQLHRFFGDDYEEIWEGERTARTGCVDTKKLLVERILRHYAAARERYAELMAHPERRRRGPRGGRRPPAADRRRDDRRGPREDGAALGRARGRTARRRRRAAPRTPGASLPGGHAASPPARIGAGRVRRARDVRMSMNEPDAQPPASPDARHPRRPRRHLRRPAHAPASPALLGSAQAGSAGPGSADASTSLHARAARPATIAGAQPPASPGALPVAHGRRPGRGARTPAPGRSAGRRAADHGGADGAADPARAALADDPDDPRLDRPVLRRPQPARSRLGGLRRPRS